MPMISPLNDRECLTKIHDEVAKYQRQPWARDLAAQFDNIKELIQFVRDLDQTRRPNKPSKKRKRKP